MDRQALCREPFAQPCDHIAVDLHRMQVAQFLRILQQWPRQRTQAGADLGHQVIRLRGDHGNDSVDHTRVGQEMLAEALARSMVAWRHRMGCEEAAIEQLIT